MLTLAIGCLATGTALADGELALSMTVSPTAVSAAGQQINITYTVLNNGPEPVTDLTVTLSVAGGSAGDTTRGGLHLLPGSSENLTATYAVTGQDILSGSIVFTAQAAGMDANTDAVSSIGNPQNDASRTVNVISPALGISGSAPATFGDVGQSITATYTVTNTGNAELTSVALTDISPAGSASPSGIASLAPGAFDTFTVTYAVAQAHVDAGAMSFSAKAVGTPPVGEPVATAAAATASATGPAASPGLSLTIHTQPGAFTGAGQAVSMVYTVVNTGNITVDGVALTEVAPSGAAVSGGASTLAPGESANFTVTYTVQQADVNVGVVNFSAKAAGTPKRGQAVATVAVTASAAGPAATAKASLALSAKPKTYGWAGQNITLTFTVTNTGNVTLTGLTGLLTAPENQAVTLNPATLAPGATATGAVTYTVTQANASARKAIEFSGTASATDPSGVGIAIPAAKVTVGYQPSDDATLRSMLGRRIGESRHAGTQNNPKKATVYVRHSARTLQHVDVEASHSRAWVSFGSDWKILSNTSMPLEVGKNDVYVCVTAESNARLYYHITLWRADVDGKYYDEGQAPATLMMNGSAIPVTVSGDGGLVIPLTALLLDSSSVPVAINPTLFGNNLSYVALDIPGAWFDETGHRRRFDISGMGLVEINDRMLENLTLAGSTIRIRIKKGSLEVTITQGGAPLAWDNRRNPMVIGVAYTPQAGARLSGIALYQDQGALEPRRVAARSWYQDGMVYGYVHQNGRYDAANMITEPVTDSWGTDLSEAAYAMLARGVLEGLEQTEAQVWYIESDPVARSQFEDMLVRALDMQVEEEEELIDVDEVETTLSRQEMWLLIYDAMIEMNALPSADSVDFALLSIQPPEAVFADWADVDENARLAIQILALFGIVEGETLRPAAAVTLGDAVHLLNNILLYSQTLLEIK